jgi:hypothetical protein
MAVVVASLFGAGIVPWTLSLKSKAQPIMMIPDNSHSRDDTGCVELYRPSWSPPGLRERRVRRQTYL